MQDTEEIKSRLNVADVLAEYIQLTPSGANFKAKCPFHNEKTPSFYVSPEKQIWHCFGCNLGGDIFTFVQKMEGIEFREALKILADKAGVRLAARNPDQEAKRNRLVGLCDWASRFYHQALLRSREGKIARDYLASRQINSETIENFLLGYSPDSWNLTLNFLRKKGFSEAEIFDAGLTSQKTPGRFYDRFRGRLMFPLRNVHGQTIGFGARVLNEKKDFLGKYINSPQTLVYDKSNFLYALDQAKTKIKEEKLSVAVEGYLDVISSHQAGIANVVGVSGTALTPGQLNLIKRYATNLALCFDADEAGFSAGRRGLENAIAAGIAVRMVILPKGEDPDSLIRKDKKAWSEAIAKAAGVLEFYFDLACKTHDPGRLEDKKMIAAELLPLIQKIPDQIEQAYYLQKLSSLIDIPEASLREAMQGLGAENSPDRETQGAPDVSSPPAPPAEILGRRLLGLGLKYPKNLAIILKKLPLPLFSQELQDIYNFLQKYYNLKRGFDLSRFIRKIKAVYPHYATPIEVAILDVEKDFEEKPEDEAIAKEARAVLKRLREEHYHSELANIEREMQKAEKAGQKDILQSLTQKLQSLTQNRL